jgi:hypothetical protein
MSFEKFANQHTHNGAHLQEFKKQEFKKKEFQNKRFVWQHSIAHEIMHAHM